MNTPSAVNRMSTRTRLIVAASAVTSLAVSAASATASWHGLTRLSAMASMPHEVAWCLPVAADGMQIAASLSLLAFRQIGGSRSHVGAWLVIYLGTAISAAGNAFAAPGDALARSVWAAGPICLAIVWHLLVGLVDRAVRRSETSSAVPAVPAATVRTTRAVHSARLAAVPAVHAESTIRAEVPAVSAQPSAIPAEAERIAGTPTIVGTVDREALVTATLDRLHANGQTVTAAGWRLLLTAEPALDGVFTRPDRALPKRITTWGETIR